MFQPILLMSQTAKQRRRYKKPTSGQLHCERNIYSILLPYGLFVATTLTPGGRGYLAYLVDGVPFFRVSFSPVFLEQGISRVGYFIMGKTGMCASFG